MKKIALLLILIMASCGPKEQVSRATISYVSDIISDKDCHEYKLLESELISTRDISIIANSNDCELLSEYLVSYDKHDNVSASLLSDELPDFAGEIFTCIELEPEVFDCDTLELRNLAVKSTIAALDTTFYLSPYDVQGVGGKKSSKIIVLSDPQLEAYGKFDIDTLFASTSCKVKLVSGFDYALDKILSSYKTKPINLGIISREGNEQVCKQLFDTKAPQGSHCIVINSQAADSLMCKLVDELVKIDRPEPINAIIVDDYSLDIDLLKLELADMLSMMSPMSLVYRHLLAEDLLILDTRQLIAESIYSELRLSNLFTHKVAYPQINPYSAIRRDGSIILIPSLYVQD